LWVDLFPLAKLKDNIIMAMWEGRVDPDEFSKDLMGGIFDVLGCPGDDPSCTSNANTLDFTLVGTAASYIYETNSPSGRSANEMGLIAWSDPWDINGWEITEQFARKWRWLMEGRFEVFSSTNKWRTARGEEPLS
jgi:hypothetical protein